MKIKYKIPYTIKKWFRSINVKPSQIFNVLLTVFNIITVLFNSFPQINPFCSDIELLAANNVTSAQIELATIYYNQGNYEEACKIYAKLTTKSNKKVAGAAYNNLASIYNNCYLNYGAALPENENIIYTIFCNLYGAIENGNEVAKENLNKFSELYEDPISDIQTFNTPQWIYDTQIISEYPLVSTEDKKYVFAGGKVSSSGDMKTNKYTYTYNVYVSSKNDLSAKSDVKLKYDVTIIKN